VSRFISGDLTLVKEVLENNDSENNTRTSFESRVNPETNERLVIVESVSKEESKYGMDQYDENMKFLAFKNKYENLLNKNKIVLKQKDDKIDELKLMLINSDKRREEAEKRQDVKYNTLIGIATATKSTLDTVLPHTVAIKITDPDYPQVFILRDLDADDNEYNFYAMRCQSSSYNKRVKELKLKHGDNIKRTFTIKQPNAIAFWKSVKKELRDNMECDSATNWFSLKDITKLQFKKKIAEMEDKRLNRI
jgi:hypothetical protein